jgi:RNA polymerase sigma factor (TIGR02999 family)
LNPIDSALSFEPDTTELVSALRSGEPESLERLFTHLYKELHARAHGQLMRGRAGETLSTTVLVHETFLKFAGSPGSRLSPADRGHFLALSARAMRQIIIDHARRAGAQKRGGDAILDSVSVDALPGTDSGAALLALDEALTALSGLDERLARMVELRFFAGLSVEETAEVLDVSPRTVKRDWRKARAFLFEAMGET